MDGYTCRDCGHYHDSYNHLKHLDWNSGGFCQSCGSEYLTADSEQEQNGEE